MTPRRCVLSTVGTSLLTNRASREQQQVLRDTANWKDDQLTPELRRLLEQLAGGAEDLLAKGSVAERRRVSAELNGIYGLYDNQLAAGRQDLHFLLATDTAQGRATAEVVAGHLRTEKVPCEVYAPAGLSTQSQANFANGIRAVIEWCDQTLPGYREAGYRVVFNLVGSFKSLQGYLNTIGMFYADEIIYIFEAPTADLLRIPRLPLRVDLGLLTRERAQFALLAAGQIVAAERLAGWPEALWESDDRGSATLSNWGLLAWNGAKPELLAEALLALPRLRYTPAFERDFAGHVNAQERVQLQETLARVSVLLQEHAGDTARLKADGGLQYDNYTGANRDVGHFRVSRGLRVSCGTAGDGLVLYRFGKEEEVNARPR